MTYFCRPICKLASPWFPQQKDRIWMDKIIAENKRCGQDKFMTEVCFIHYNNRNKFKNFEANHQE